MTDGEEKLIELMSLLLDEQRDMKSELRQVNTELRDIKSQQRTTNDCLAAIEYALLNDTRELRQRVERLESHVGKIEDAAKS